MDSDDLDRRLQVAASHIVVPQRPLPHAAHRRTASAGAVAASLAVLVAAAVIGQQLAARRGGDVVATSPTPTASASRAATPSPTVTSTPPVQPPLVPYESKTLGYRIEVPDGFRLSDCLSGLSTRDEPWLGGDTFTLLTPEQERSEERGHVARGGSVAMWTFSVNVWKAEGMSAAELAERDGCPTCARITRPGQRIEPLVLGGHEAARSILDAEARLYAVRAGDRIYVIELYSNPYDPTPRPSILPAGILDSVSVTFRGGPATPIPTPTPHPAVPRSGARETAGQLATALEAGDARRVAMLITPRCWLDVSFPNAGPTGLAVMRYVAELQTRFASGGLRVRVDPAVQVADTAGPDRLRLFVRSEWTESGRTTRIDLYLEETDGRWYWAGSRHHEPQP